MQIVERQREEFAERSGMVDDAEHAARGAMAAEAARAPCAFAACQIDLTGDAAADPTGIFTIVIDGDHFAYELVSGSAGKTVVAALKFEIGGANAGGEQANAGKARGDAGERLAAYFDAAGFKVDAEHGVWFSEGHDAPRGALCAYT